MKRTVLAIALMLGAVCANAQETTSSGDLYQGLTRKIAFERMIPPHGLEITYDKTVHIIFLTSSTEFAVESYVAAVMPSSAGMRTSSSRMS